VEIEVLQAEKSRREPVVKQLFEKTVTEDAKLKQLLADSQRQRSTQEKQLQELQQGIAMYQRLGLFFEHTEGQMENSRWKRGVWTDVGMCVRCAFPSGSHHSAVHADRRAEPGPRVLVPDHDRPHHGQIHR
jgi:hypothetical protein